MQAIDLIILAAGKSSRYGSLKGFAHYNGSPLLSSAIELHQNNFLGKTIIVYSDYSLEYEKVLSKKYPNAIFTLNPEPDYGPFSSLQEGLKKSDSDHILILPVDCPARLIKTWKELTHAITPQKSVYKPRKNNKSGHPIIINREIKSLILRSQKTNQLNQLLKSINFNEIMYVETEDPEILNNINSKTLK